MKNVADQPLQNAPADENAQVDTDVICTEQHAVDFDGDGDLDLVVGCFGTKFFLYENFAEKHDGVNTIAEHPSVLPIESTSHHSAPHLVDWDNDGDLDLLSGTSDGGAIISENVGTRSEPKWSEFKQLVPPSNVHEQTTLDGKRIEMGRSTRIWATDWNGDGLQDLLIGDSTTINNPASGIDIATWKRRRAEDDAKVASISMEMQEFMPEYQEAAEKGEEPPAEVLENIERLSERMQEVYNGRADYQDSRSTGHVWLLIRKPDETPREPTGETDT